MTDIFILSYVPVNQIRKKMCQHHLLYNYCIFINLFIESKMKLQQEIITIE